MDKVCLVVSLHHSLIASGLFFKHCLVGGKGFLPPRPPLYLPSHGRPPSGTGSDNHFLVLLESTFTPVLVSLLVHAQYDKLTGEEKYPKLRNPFFINYNKVRQVVMSLFSLDLDDNI